MEGSGRVPPEGHLDTWRPPEGSGKVRRGPCSAGRTSARLLLNTSQPVLQVAVRKGASPTTPNMSTRSARAAWETTVGGRTTRQHGCPQQRLQHLQPVLGCSLRADSMLTGCSPAARSAREATDRALGPSGAGAVRAEAARPHSCAANGSAPGCVD